MAKKITHAEMISALALAFQARARVQGWKKGTVTYVTRAIEFWLGAAQALAVTNSPHQITDQFLGLWVACGHDTDSLILHDWAFSVSASKTRIKVRETNYERALEAAHKDVQERVKKGTIHLIPGGYTLQLLKGPAK